MVDRVTAVEEIDSTPASALRLSMATATPRQAEISGIPAASSEQRAIVSTIRATTRPISSLESDPPPDELENAGPPTSILRLLDWSALAMFCSASRLPLSKPDDATVYWTAAMAVLPSLVTVPVFCGVNTAATWGALAAFVSASLTAAALALVCSVVSPCAWNSSCALVPLAVGNSFATTSSAFCDCEPGIVNELSSCAFAAFTPTIAAIKMTTHTATTRHLWL